MQIVQYMHVVNSRLCSLTLQCTHVVDDKMCPLTNLGLEAAVGSLQQHILAGKVSRKACVHLNVMQCNATQHTIHGCVTNLGLGGATAPLQKHNLARQGGKGTHVTEQLGETLP